MALKVKTIAQSTDKWKERASGAADEFATEAANAADLWQSKTMAAKDNFRMAIAAPGIAERFVGGVRRAGAAKFARKIRDVARDRFGPGIQAATEDYASRVEPFFSTLAGLTLSARRPRGDPANLTRVAEVTKALHNRRLALLGAGSS